MRALASLWLLLFACVPSLAQNGARSVAARASQAEALPSLSDALDRAGCHKNYAAGCALPRDPAHKGKFLSPNPKLQPKYDPYLAYFKNQIPTILPANQGFLKEAGFISKYRAALKAKTKITQSNHADVSSDMLGLGEGQYFTVVGYLFYAQVSGGGEACNCDIQNYDPADDYHIGVGFDSSLSAKAPNAANNGSDMSQLRKHSIIVEMTPHYRAKYHNGKWTYSLLQSILGRQIKVVGQLLLDNDHMGANAVCGSPSSSSSNNNLCWRLSPWELHPVTEFYVCKADQCPDQSPNWVALDDAPANGIGKF